MGSLLKGTRLIISASRRTDIPAFYSKWFMNRIRAGYCTVPNPFNRKQISSVSLRPEDVEIIVFWTRNPQPLFPCLKELNQRGYPYYFLFTLMDNPRHIDTKIPSFSASLRNFQNLSNLIGPEKVIWRYDPIVFSGITGIQFHIDTYGRIAEALRNHTYRSVISIVDIYSKMSKRLRKLAQQGIKLTDSAGELSPRFGELVNALVQMAKENDVEIFSCAETQDLKPYGIRPGKCIDNDYIETVFKIKPTDKKDPSQRKLCGCVLSKDIGMYETCLFGCQYCYATTHFSRAKMNHELHDPNAPSLIGWYDESIR